MMTKQRLTYQFKSDKAFTLIELIIVIVVIGILAALTTVGFARLQAQSRDSIRTVDVSVIAEALEKYYDENGEYPSCTQMTAAPSDVSQVLSVDASTLRAPLSDQDNSYICNALSSASGDDEFAYVGDGSPECQTGNSCLHWEIQYRNEQTGEIRTISSRRTAALASSGAPSITLSVVSNTQINASWSSVPNATSYRVDRSTNSTMSGAVSQTVSGTSVSATGLVPGERYYFRVTPKLAAQDGQPGAADAVTTISAPSGTIATSASLQTSNTEAQGIASGVSCQSGTTLQYALGSQARNTNSPVNITYGGWGTGNTATVSASQGYNYTFQSKARCHGSDADSNEVASSTANVTRPIDKPAAPNYTGDTSMHAGYRYSMTYSSFCPAGTWVQDYIYIYNTGFSGSGYNPTSSSGGAVNTPWGRYFTAPLMEWWYLGWNNNQVWEDLYYYAFYACKTDFTSSAHSDHRQTYVTVECTPDRRSYSANPRCDDYGQSVDSLPWGP